MLSSIVNFMGTLKLSSSLVLVLVLDVVLTALSFMGSYFICSFLLPGLNINMMLVQLPLIISVSSLIFLLIGSYRGFIKYDRVTDVYHIFNAICLANILTIVVIVINGKTVMIEDITVPLSIIVVHSILSFIALVVARLFYKTLYSRFSDNHVTTKNVLLVGSGKYIRAINISLKNFETKRKFNVVGFVNIDEDFSQYDFDEHFPIFLKKDINKTLVKNLNPAKIIIAIPEISQSQLAQLTSVFGNFGIKMGMIEFNHEYYQWSDQLKVETIEDLEKKQNLNETKQELESMKNRLPLHDRTILILADAPDLDKELIKLMFDLKSSTQFILYGKNSHYLSELVKALNGLGFNNTVVTFTDEALSDIYRNQLILQNNPDKIYIASSGAALEFSARKRQIEIGEMRSSFLLEILNKHYIEKFSQ